LIQRHDACDIAGLGLRPK